jgi:hypothetical protein
MLNLHYQADKGRLGRRSCGGLIERIERDEDAASAAAPAGGAARPAKSRPEGPNWSRGEPGGMGAEGVQQGVAAPDIGKLFRR